MDCQKVVDTFKERLDLKVPDHNRVAGRGVPESLFVVREDENEEAIGGLRNAARAVDRVPGWQLVGCRISKLIEEMVEKHQQTLEPLLSRLGRQVEPRHSARCVARGIAVQISFHLPDE